MTHLKHVPILLLGLGFFASCSDDDDDEVCCDPSNPECSNYDPCFGKIETTAYFTIAQRYAQLGENANVFIEDDIVTGGTLKFSAIPQAGAVYTWVLGIDTIIGGPEVTIPLGNLPLGTYSNSLMVTKIPDSLCFPMDDGVAQFSRAFTRIDICDRAILGRFRGVFSNLPTDSTEIEIIASSSVQSIQPCNLPSIESVIFAVNFSSFMDTTRLFLNGGVNSQISFESLNNLDKPEGEVIYNAATNLATANYVFDNTSYSFSGRKL